MFVFELFDLDHALVLEFSELLLPISVKLLELFISNLNILPELVGLNIDSKLILESINVGFKKSHFSHEIFVELIFLHVA